MTSALKLVHSAQQEPAKRDYINRLTLTSPKTGVIFADFVQDTVRRKSKRMGEYYIKNYNSLINHLNGFAKKYDAVIYTNSVNEEFLDDFICYLQDEDYKQGYIRLLFTLAKGMVAKAAVYGYAVDPSYDDVQVDREETFAIYLSMNDITRIYYYQGLTRIQEKWRDLFVLGCLTGLRYSDYSTLKPENFQGEYIVKKTKKTGIIVNIPIHDYIKELYTKYDGNLPSGLSIQQFNRHLKNIGKKVGFTEPVTYYYTRGGKLITKVQPKYELISSHTARRSAATNMYLTGRMKTYQVMALTGHTTEKSFFRYIKITTEDKAKQIAGDNIFRK